jgi:hypothetical protein
MPGIRSRLAWLLKPSTPATAQPETPVEGSGQEPTSESAADELAERGRRAAESILDNESLIADLDQDAARVLLDWGVACARAIAADTAGLGAAQVEEVMDVRLRAVRQFMRSINGWVAEQEGMDAEGRAARLADVLEQVAVAYGPGFARPAQKQCDAFLAAQVEPSGAPQRWIAELRALVEQA